MGRGLIFFFFRHPSVVVVVVVPFGSRPPARRARGERSEATAEMDRVGGGGGGAAERFGPETDTKERKDKNIKKRG